MTVSNYKKVFKQLKARPAKLNKYIKHNAPKKRSCGKSKKQCISTGRIGGRVSKYGLNLCRQAFRQLAPKLGFKKYN